MIDLQRFLSRVRSGGVRWGLAFILGLSTSLSPLALAGQSGGGTASVLEIPVAIDIGPFARAADERLPREAGHWRSWRKEHGIETRYRAWRGPLLVQAQGDRVLAQAHVRYWVRARKRLIGGLGLDAGCGVEDEPPRQALIGLEMRIGWAPDWTLRPAFRILPVHFLDRCEVTALDIDVSPLIGRLFRERMEAALREALAELSPRLEAARRQAAGHWQALQPPAELMPGVWLEPNPMAVALAPPRGTGQRLTTVLGLVLAPRILVGEPEARPPRPLPPLQVLRPRGGGMTFDLALDLDLAAVGRHLSRALEGRTLEVEGRQVRLGPVSLAVEDGQLKAETRLGGEGAGRVAIWATPVLDPETQRIALRDLEHVYDAEDPGKALLADLFYQRIRRALEDGANGLLTERSDALRQGLARALGRALPPELDLDLSELRVRELDLTLSDRGLRLRGTGYGLVSVSAR